MHAHSETMAVWRVRGGQKELIYQSFDWAEPDSATYNTVVKNPLPNAAAKQDGGVSGLMIIEPGDSLEWSCDVNNTLDHGDPLRQRGLHGGNVPARWRLRLGHARPVRRRVLRAGSARRAFRADVSPSAAGRARAGWYS